MQKFGMKPMHPCHPVEAALHPVPLHSGCSQGHWAAARLLLEALPALASVRDKHGHQAPTEAL